MAKKVFKIFVMGFLKALFVLVCMILCGVGGFFGTRLYYTKKIEKDNKKQAEKLIGSAQIDDISKNLIYVWDKDNNKVKACVLEVFNTEEGKMNYITIPTDSQIVIGASIYKKLYQVNQELPQVFTLSKLCKYFEKDDMQVFGYGVLILENYFNIDISYYSVVPEDVFADMFEGKKVEIDEKGNLVGTHYDTVSISADDDDDATTESGDDPFAHDDRFSTTKNRTTQAPEETATTQAGTTTEADSTTEAPVAKKTRKTVYEVADSFSEKITAAGDITTYVEQEIDNVQSNLDVKDKLSYVKKYEELTQDDIQYYCIPGEQEGSHYTINEDNAVKLLRKCGINAVADVEQSDSEEDNSDEEQLFNIVILNSTHIAGVAGKWSEEFTMKGYNVKQIGNYDTTLTDTQIIVKEEGQGDEFLRYFTNAEIKVGTVPAGADAQIIIGTNDVKQ